MRRARIKVTASVPLRRKVVKEEPPEQNPENTENVDGVRPPENSVDPGVELKLDEKPTEAVGSARLEKTPKVPDVPDSTPVDPLLQNSTQKSSEVVKAISAYDAVISRRPRLFSESSETKGHVSGSEASSPPKSVLSRTSFMRPIPRLDGAGRIRRNSVQGSGASASESEDDSRRQIPIPPHQATPLPQQTDKQPQNNQNPAKIQMKQKRKMIVSESARKLAEARREFLLKHENKQPDRTKLTMYDLIYYNPSTNPMKNSGSSQPLRRSDEPEEDDSEPEEVEDMAMPVPQLKVGPNGQLIVDEQSLVIENTALKRDREAVAKRRVLVDDEGAIGGFYKKRTKSKEWPKWETLKFYKALNTVGTDFSLMQSLFPKRTRHELKMKFKKEEKLNRKLVEKALTYHQEYDPEVLRKDLETFENVEETYDDKKTKGNKKIEKFRRKIAAKRMAATSINLLSEDEEEGDTQDVAEIENPRKKPKRKSYTSKKKELVECDSFDEESMSEDNFEVYKVKPTRSGRLPKKKKSPFNPQRTLDAIFGPADNENNDAANDNDSRDVDRDPNMNVENMKTTLEESVAGLEDVEPGSLVIVSKESPDEPGKTFVQVYMVSKNVNGSGESMTPISLSSEILSTITNGLSSVSPVKEGTKQKSDM